MPRMLAFTVMLLLALFYLFVWWIGRPSGGYAALPALTWPVIPGLVQFLWIRTLKRRLLQLGWEVRWNDVLGPLSMASWKDLEHLLPREEFIVLPQYRSDRRDIQNILACIEFSKQEERSREVYDAIRPYIEEHEREGEKRPQ